MLRIDFYNLFESTLGEKIVEINSQHEGYVMLRIDFYNLFESTLGESSNCVGSLVMEVDCVCLL